MYGYELLDPRPIPAAATANDRVFGFGVPVYGIDVTVPALAARCVYNLDPQHTGGDANLAAIEAALTEELPPMGTILATIRADLDAVGAMAIIVLREQDFVLSPETMNRVVLVAAADTFARGNWPGQQRLPTTENPWPAESASAESVRELAAIAAAIGDFKVPIDDRIGAMINWLLCGEEPAQYRAQVERERLDLISAIESGAIKTRVSGLIAMVESTHRAATLVGYALAPVVVALNPAFKLGGGDAHKKFTVCQYTAGYVDLRAVVAELASMEAGWGGSPTIIGSPQGVGSTLTIDDVVMVVERHYI